MSDKYTFHIVDISTAHYLQPRLGLMNNSTIYKKQKNKMQRDSNSKKSKKEKKLRKWLRPMIIASYKTHANTSVSKHIHC